MKKNLIILVLVLAITKLYGQEYYVIDFVGEGATIASIFVENLTQGTSVELAGTDVLHLLLETTDVSNIEMGSKNLNIFPNPMEQTASIEFFNAKQGNVNIGVYSLTGKQIHNYSNDLSKGIHTFSLSGVAAGSYVISVKTETDYFTGKFVSLKQTESSPTLNHKVGVKTNNITENTGLIEPTLRNTLNNKGIKSIVEMDFEIGDELKFIGSAGGFENVVIFDSPTSNQTYTFVFEVLLGQPCSGMPEFTDTRDDNIYQTVQIGDQCWMVENLAYLPSVVGPQTGSQTTPYYYVYGYNGTDVNAAKATANYQNYGVLYNWPAAMNGAESSEENPSGVQGICPPGWHLPSDAEWTELVDYVVSQGYPNHLDSNSGAGNALKSCRQVDSPLGGNCDTSEHPRWNSHSTHSGFDEFGFTAFPGGFRSSSGNFGNVGDYGIWWSASEGNTAYAWSRGIYRSNGSVYRGGSNKELSISVRCVRDN